MNYTEEDLDKALDKLLIERGEHPTRVRNPLYGEERNLAKDLVKLFTIPDVSVSSLNKFKLYNEALTAHNYSDFCNKLHTTLKDEL